MSSEHRDGYWHSQDGTKLFWQEWLPFKREQRACVILSHGRGEHSGRYRDFALGLNAAGMCVCCYDCRGHGRSEGEPRGHVDNFEQYLEDLRGFVARCRQEYSELPLLLFGHSQGALISLIYVQQEQPRDVCALAVTSPFFDVSMPVPAWKSLLAEILGKLAPRVSMSAGYSGEVLSHDPQIRSAYDSDPLNCHTVSAGWYRAVIEAQRRCLQQPERLVTPTLIIAAGADGLVSTPAIQRFAASLDSPHELHVAAGAFHEVLNEPEHKEDVRARIIAWYERWALTECASVSG